MTEIWNIVYYLGLKENVSPGIGTNLSNCPNWKRWQFPTLEILWAFSVTRWTLVKFQSW